MNNQFIQRIGIDWNGIGRDSYLRDIDALKGLELLEFGKPVTFFVGENGSGKSTLLEAIAVAYGFNPEGGTKNYSFSPYDSHSEQMCIRDRRWDAQLPDHRVGHWGRRDFESGKRVDGDFYLSGVSV